MPDLAFEINRSVSTPFRRAYIRRRLLATGLFETTWREITEFVKGWGTHQQSIDDSRLNRFTHNGISLLVRNDTGAFLQESRSTSLWSGYLNRYRTLLRINAGYTQDDATELPTDTTMGIYIIDGEIDVGAKNNDVVLNAKSLVSIFDEVRARDVVGLGTTQTAGQLIERIRDHTDGAGVFVFREFITSTSWSIQTTTANYNLATTTSIEASTVWGLMEQIAEAEGFVIYLDRAGTLTFRDRSITSTVTFTMSGQSFPEQNVIDINSYKEALDKHYNFFRMKWDEPETTTSYVTSGTTTVLNPTNTSWLQGQRVYDYKNDFFNTSTAAQTSVNGLFTLFNTLRSEIELKAKFLPQINVLDRIHLNYRSYDIANTTLWNSFIWASASAISITDGGNWAGDQGESFDFTNEPFYIIGKRTNLDDFTTSLVLRSL